MSGEIDRKEVVYLATLARLDLDEDELDLFAGQLSSILEHVETVRALDTSQLVPTAHALELVNVLRPDEVRPSLDPQEVLAAAPAAEAGRFKVPPVLGEAP